MAHYIDANSTNPNSPWQSLITALNGLSASGVQNALDQMSGALYGSASQTDFQSTTLELSLIARRLGNGLSGTGGAPGGLAINSYGERINDAALAANDSNLIVRGQNVYAPFMPQGRWTTWGFGYGLGGNAQGNGNAAGLNYSLGGTVAGLEMRDGNHLIGGYAGYVGSHLGSYLAGQSVGVNGGQTGIYLRGDDGRNYYIVLGGMGADGYDSHRLMQFGGINTTASANYGGWQSQAYLERGITLQGSKGSIQPYAALQYLYVRQNSFTETGAGVMNLKVAGIDANSLRSLIGVRLAGNAGLSTEWRPDHSGRSGALAARVPLDLDRPERPVRADRRDEFCRHRHQPGPRLGDSGHRFELEHGPRLASLCQLRRPGERGADLPRRLGRLSVQLVRGRLQACQATGL